jgi:putative transposase
VTEHPTTEWTAAQLTQAFPWDTPPRYLLRDRDRIYGDAFRKQAASMEIAQVLTAPRSPWRSPFVERLIGSISRERLDQVIVVNERSLRRQIAGCIDYYHGSRSLGDKQLCFPPSVKKPLQHDSSCLKAKKSWIKNRCI